MRSVVVQFPGTNRERDMIAALRLATETEPVLVWHADTELPKADLIVLPGGFSYGDYLRAGAIAAHSPIMESVKRAADQGVLVLGICNGFQALCESGLLPGALMRNASLNFVCRNVELRIENTETPFTCLYKRGATMPCPVAHHDGNYFADPETLERLESDLRVIFRYDGGTNPNGSQRNIAGILNEGGNVLGLMPHPENRVEAAHGGTEGLTLFKSLVLGISDRAA